jgi:hypothetical protein
MQSLVPRQSAWFLKPIEPTPTCTVYVLMLLNNKEHNSAMWPIMIFLHDCSYKKNERK